jgi:hypothetical protein
MGAPYSAAYEATEEAPPAMTTAPWPWTPRDGNPVAFHLTDAHLSAIRRLVAWWDDTEAGAPGLAHPDLTPLGGRPRTELETAVEVFLDAATLPEWDGPVTSPWDALPPDEADDWLSDLPDPALRDRWQRGAAHTLTPSEEARTLWSEANRGASGIDPKRPFGTAVVARDVQRLLDPDKTLDDDALTALSDRTRAELLPMLQRFVQHATLPLGPYARIDGCWAPGTPPAEALDAPEWWWRLCGEAAAMNTAYSATLRALHHLVDEGRIAGDHAELVERFALDDHYGAPQHLKWTGSWSERLDAAIAAFPDQRVFRLQLIRQANARADHAVAREHLEAMDRWAGPLPGLSLANPGWPAILLLERLVCRRGLGLLDSEGFLDALTDDTHDAEATPWDVVYRTLHEGRAVFEDAVLWRHGQAVSAQIQLMRAAQRS